MHHEDHKGHPIGLWTLWLLLARTWWQLTMEWFKSAGDTKGRYAPVLVKVPRVGITYVSSIVGESHIMLTSMKLHSSRQEMLSRQANNWALSAVQETLNQDVPTAISQSRWEKHL